MGGMKLLPHSVYILYMLLYSTNLFYILYLYYIYKLVEYNNTNKIYTQWAKSFIPPISFLFNKTSKFKKKQILLILN